MKTLLITPDLFGHAGGIARIMRLYLQALGEIARPGDTLEYCTLLDTGDTSQQARELIGSRLGEHRNAAGNRLRFTVQMLGLARHADFLLCGHLHLLPLAWTARQLRPSLSYALVAHGIEVWRPFSTMERLPLGGAARIFCVSHYTRRQILRFHPQLDPNRLVVLPNTFDPRFTPPPGEPSERSAATIVAPRILTVSRLDTRDRHKGVDTLIEAMPRFRALQPEATLRIVGRGDDQPRLAALARSLQIAEAVRFLGAIDDTALAHEYAACDLFALPSAKEGFGLVYLEAMSYGKPCLAARAGGAPEVVNRDVGVLVDYGDSDQIAAALHELIRHPRSASAIRAHVAKFAFPQFCSLLRAYLPRIA